MGKDKVIPSEFYLYGHKIKVCFDKQKLADSEAYGLTDYGQNYIWLTTENRGRELAIEFVESTFYHELMHQVFDKAGYPDLAKDERLVDVIGALIHQFIKTANYGELVEHSKNTSPKRNTKN